MDKTKNTQLGTAKSEQSDPDDDIAAIAESFSRDTPNPAVCVVDGYGAQVRVERGRLVACDGIGEQRRTRRYARATHGLCRLVVLAQGGTISLDALRWCSDTGVAVVVLDPFDSRALLTSAAMSNDDARLRRSQAMALGTDAGIEIARYLIGLKLRGQAAVALKHLEAPGTAETIAVLSEMLADAESLNEVRQIEASGANAYFAAWGRLDVPFIRRDLPRIPDHWCRFEGRRSAVNPATARNGTDPLNAMLNLCYRLAETEARVACLALGMDPALGVLHADAKGRDSFVLDLLEVARPIADAFVLDVIQARPLRKADFTEDRRGVVQVLAPLSHRLAEAMPQFAKALAPAIEHVASLLAKSSPYNPNVPALLTGTKHREAAALRGARSTAPSADGRGPNPGGLLPRAKQLQRPSVRQALAGPARSCRGCGTGLAIEAERGSTRRWWCDECLPERRTELDQLMRRAAAAAALQFKDEAGVLPSHTPSAQARRQVTNRHRQLARLAWDADHGGTTPDVDWYLEQVAPRLADLSLTEIAGALGVSTSSASKFRRGLRVPAPRHWPALAQLLGANKPARSG